jgi:alpha-mannosidase
MSELEIRVEVDRPAGVNADSSPLNETVPLTVSTVARLVRGSRRVEFRTTIDNQAADHRLRVIFPVGAAAGPVRAEGQFALVRRPLAPPRPRTEWIEPPDPTQHTCGAVAIGPLALLTKGLPEYEARTVANGTELCLTLLRCVGVISKPTGALETRPRSAGPQLSTPEGQCLGRHECEYAIVPDGNALGEIALLRESQDYRSDFLTVAEPIHVAPPLSLEGEVIFSCLKGAENGDGLILRCFNPTHSDATAQVAGDVAVSQTRLDETGEQPLPDGAMRLRPGELATVRLRLR